MFSTAAIKYVMDMRTCLARVARLAALCGALLGAGPVAAGIADYPFRIVAGETGTESQVTAVNDGPAPVTVRIEVIGTGIASDREWPVTAVVPAHASLILGRVHANGQSDAPFSARYFYSYHFGALDAVHAAAVAYRLPFEDGRGFEVSQAYGGRLTSHDNSASQYAVDFAMPAGSPIMAARAGVVIDVTLRYTEGGYDPAYLYKANTVAVLHDDGTVAEYAHLSPGPAVVTPGKRVDAGDLLGYSGSTGYSSEAHLHFSVTRTIISEGQVMHEAVPVQFYSGDTAATFSAQMGTTVWANYAAGMRIATLHPRRAQ